MHVKQNTHCKLCIIWYKKYYKCFSSANNTDPGSALNHPKCGLNESYLNQIHPVIRVIQLKCEKFGHSYQIFNFHEYFKEFTTNFVLTNTSIFRKDFYQDAGSRKSQRFFFKLS